MWALRVLHTADVHLDSDGYGNAADQAAQRERERLVFRRIVECAVGGRVDLLLIADVSQGRVAAHYAGAPALERQDGECAVLRIDFWPTAGIRVSDVRL